MPDDREPPTSDRTFYQILSNILAIYNSVLKANYEWIEPENTISTQQQIVKIQHKIWYLFIWKIKIQPKSVYKNQNFPPWQPRHFMLSSNCSVGKAPTGIRAVAAK